MNQEAKELYAFMKAIETNPNDFDTRLVYADWLDDHDMPEEAHTQRKYCEANARELREAEEYVRQFCVRYHADYDELLHAIREGDGYCFGDDDGPYEARTDGEFHKAVERLLGAKYLKPFEDQGFRCAC